MNSAASSITYRCLQCNSPLVKNNARIFCKQCGFEREIKEKVIVFETAPYWGEFSQAEMQKLIDNTKHGYWLEEIERKFSDVNSQRYRSVADLNRASWISMLPLKHDSEVLDIGAGLGAITHALALNYRHVIALEPVFERAVFTSLRAQQEQFDHIEVISANILNMPFFESCFDLIIMNGILEWIGEWDLNNSPKQAQQKVLDKVHSMLKPGGILLIGIENRIGLSFWGGSPDHYGIPYTSLLPRKLASRYLKKKAASFYRTTLNPDKQYRTYTYSLQGYRQLLSNSGFRRVSFCSPHPNYNSPLEVIPLESNKIFAACYFRRANYRSHWLKYVTRWLAIKTGLLRQLSSHFLIIATKCQASANSFFNSTTPSNNFPGFIASKLHVGPDDILFYLRTRSCLNKHTLWVIERESAKLLAVAKIANVNREQSELLALEYENLKWLHDLGRNDENFTSSVPAILAFDKLDNNLLLLQRYVAGTSLHLLLKPNRIHARPDSILPLFERAFEWLCHFHSISQNGADKFQNKENSLKSPSKAMIAPHIPISGGLSDLLGTDQILRQSNYPQHGDFSPVNILIQKSHVGVIDWEDTKIGYPPLFDFFCLFTPLMNFHNAESISDSLAFFDGMYFSRNRFSRFIREKIMTYCRNFGIDRDLVPLHFFDFLWVKHNRFADKKNYGLATLFLEFMKYFDKNIDRYLVNLFQ